MGNMTCHFLEILSSASLSWNETISEIRLLTPDDKVFDIPGENITWSKSYRFPACQTLDLFDYLKMEEITPLKITFDFERLENHRLTLHLEDRDKGSPKKLHILRALPNNERPPTHPP